MTKARGKDAKINFKKNSLIMALPLSLPAIPIMIVLGESAFLFVIPLLVGLLLALKLAKKLDVKDAIAYPFVQYTFLLFLFYLFWAYPNVGLGLIIIVPKIYIINTVLVYLYFQFVKKKTMPTRILVLMVTLLVTSFFYAEHYGQNRSTPVLFRMLSGDFGDTSWSRERITTDTVQVTSDGIFEYRLEQVHRSTPLGSNTELRLFVRDLNLDTEYRIRLDDVMNEDRVLLHSRPHGRDFFWSTMRPSDGVEQRYLLTTTSTYAPVRRWVFELNMETQTASLLEQIHVSMIGRTEDDNFIAHLYMVNFFDNENRSVRLVMVDTETREIIHIPIEIDVTQIIVRNFDFGWDMSSYAVWATNEETGQRYLAEPARRIVGMMPTGVPERYIVILREGFLAEERRFELDMYTRTMSELN